MLTLRPFQEDLIAGLRGSLRHHQSVLLQLATGGGKTVCAAAMTRNARAHNKRVWFICHRDFLLDQTGMTFERLDLHPSYIAAGRPFVPGAELQVCSIDTLKNRLEHLIPPDLIIWDEAHHVAAGGWARVRAWAGKAKNVGLSATPVRLDGKGLRFAFSDMVCGPPMSWLMEQGYLSSYSYFAPSKPDLSALKTVAGDYSTDQLDDLMDKPAIIGDAVEHYARHSAGKRAVYFCVSIKHSIKVTEAFNAAGIKAMHLDGTSPSHERRAVARAFADGQVQVLTNVGLFGEGYDLSAQAGRDVTVETVGLMRPTKSLSLFLQMVGRAFRPKDYPAIVLDHGGCVEQHGLPDDDREWSLDGIVKKKKAPETDNGVRVCKACFAAYKATLRACPVCQEVNHSPRSGPAEKDGNLVQIDPAVLRAQRMKQEHECRDINELVDLAKARGYVRPEAWAAKVWMERDRRGQIRVEAQARDQRLW